VCLEVSGPAPKVCPSLLIVFIIPKCLRGDGVLALTVDSLGQHLQMASAREIVLQVLPVASMSCIDSGESFAQRGWMPVYLSSAWAGAVSRAPWLPKLA
jgi:hypothetical protein